MRYPGSESYLATQKRNTPSGKISGTLAPEIFSKLTNEISTTAADNCIEQQAHRNEDSHVGY